ncbi:TIGR00374 family protein OS=Streptomyces tendae OX=1932 GN=GUR47_14945 PE=4 SV=1 [Streptomyces tendae]
MKQQGVHPEDAEGTSDASSRADTADADDQETGERAAEGPSATAADPDDVAHIDEVEGDEPLLPARVHRPSDLVRLLVGVLAVAVLLAIAAFAHGTTSGLEQDINKGTGQAPDLLIKIAGLASSIAILLVPVAFAIERLIKRDGLRIADGVLAAVLAHGVTLATDLWVAKAAPGSIQEALTQPSPGDIHALTDPVHGYLAPVIAYMTAVGMSRRPRWRAVLWIVLLLDAFSMLVTGYTTPFSIIPPATSAGPAPTAPCTPSAPPTCAHRPALLPGLRHLGSGR